MKHLFLCVQVLLLGQVLCIAQPFTTRYDRHLLTNVHARHNVSSHHESQVKSTVLTCDYRKTSNKIPRFLLVQVTLTLKAYQCFIVLSKESENSVYYLSRILVS